ncbi:MAG: hypothetical protein MJA31_00590 [Clostridia bacterium]|nr:hypothetical protein [Clostridia bacterium]
MDKKECIELYMKYFKVSSTLANFKNLDLYMKSHIFYYRDIFKEVNEIKIMNVSAIDQNVDINFDIYYFSKSLDGLFNGYFKISPNTESAKQIFENVSKVCTDLENYFYYVFKNSEIMKIYLISGSIENAKDHYSNAGQSDDYNKFIKSFYNEISTYETNALLKGTLERKLLKKHITNFIKMNSKCAANVRMFLINILSDPYNNNVCVLNNAINIQKYIHINTNDIYIHGDLDIPVFGLLEHVNKINGTVFLKFEFDFEGRK